MTSTIQVLVLLWSLAWRLLRTVSKFRRAILLVLKAAMERLDELAAKRHLSSDVLGAARAQHRHRLARLTQGSANASAGKRPGELYDEVERLLIAAERERINDLFRSGKLKDEARRRIERELDMREAILSIRNQRTRARPNQNERTISRRFR